MIETKTELTQQEKIDSGLIRPYSKTSDRMIIEDLENGFPVEKIAKIYNRDVKDLKEHIEKIKGKVKSNKCKGEDNNFINLYTAIWKQAVEDDKTREERRLINEAVESVCKATGLLNKAEKKLSAIQEELGKCEVEIRKLKEQKVRASAKTGEKQRINEVIKSFFKKRKALELLKKEFIKSDEYKKLEEEYWTKWREYHATCAKVIREIPEIKETLKKEILSKVLKEADAWPKIKRNKNYTKMFAALKNEIVDKALRAERR